jgi:peptide/nickel transport system permease protein
VPPAETAPERAAVASDTTSPTGGSAAAPPDAPRRRRRRRGGLGVVGWAAVVWLATVVLSAALADLLPLAPPDATNVTDMLRPPGSPEHLLGTDGLGRDLLSRIVYGSRISLMVALVAVAIGSVVGGLIGLCVGYLRGRLDTLVMGAVDVVLAFPGLVLLLTIIAWVGRSLTSIAVSIGLLAVPIYTRVARAATMSVASREFVLAAEAMGAKRSRVLFRELLPNVLLPVSAYALISVGVVIVLEGALSFLGLSIDQPTPTWGGIMNEGRRHLTVAPHVSGAPSVVMFLTVVSLNLVGDRVRGILDVKGRNL